MPYPSSPAALTSLMSGDTQFGALPPIAVMPMVKDGRLKALAVTSSKRSALLPEIPTLAEAGVQGIEGSAWIGFVISSKAPADIQKKLSDALIQAIRDPEVAKRLQAQFMDPVGDTPAQFRAYMDDELQRWSPSSRNSASRASRRAAQTRRHGCTSPNPPARPAARRIRCRRAGRRPGLLAAASAARNGASVLLVERYGFLGGMGTAAGVSNFCGLHANVHGTIRQVVHGMTDELLDRMRALDGLNEPHLILGKIHAQAYDIPAFKCAADGLLRDSGAGVLFHALATGMARGADGDVDTLFLETKSGRRARVFIDCSGDADLAAWSGLPFERATPTATCSIPR